MPVWQKLAKFVKFCRPVTSSQKLCPCRRAQIFHVLKLLLAGVNSAYDCIMKSRFSLINSGLYPETLPPCFVSKDAKRAFHGLVGTLDSNKFHERKTEYVRYSGTKHDGSRRFFGTPNIVSYFHVSSFIWKNWGDFEANYALSSYSIGTPKIMDEGE